MKPLANYNILSPAELEAIHAASLSVLAETGVDVLSAPVRELLAKNNARVEGERVRFPRKLVEKCLGCVPATVTLYRRTGEPAFTLGADSTVVSSGHNATFVLEEDGTRHPATAQNVADFARLTDILPHLGMVGIQAIPQDVTAAVSLVHAYRQAVAHTTKPIFWSPESARITSAVMDLMHIAAGFSQDERPIGICQLSSTSPLFWETGTVEAVVDVSKRGVPLCFLPQPIAGVSAPITVAGTLVLHNAEVLSGVVISQLVRPGTPNIYGSAWTTFDMRRATPIISRPEAAIMRIAGGQMARYYHMPSHTIGPDADSHVHDEQQGWEKLFTLLSAFQGGVDLVVNAGMFATGMTVSLAQLVIDDEIAALCARFKAGMEINAETIARDVMASVGPRGNYLMEEHTLKHLKGDREKGIIPEHVELALSSASGFDVWQQAGASRVDQRAWKEAYRMLDVHHPTPLSPEVLAALDDRVAEAEAASKARS